MIYLLNPGQLKKFKEAKFSPAVEMNAEDIAEPEAWEEGE